MGEQPGPTTMTIRRMALLVLVLSSSGCHAFTQAPRVSPGETARVTLTVMRPRADGTEEPIRFEGRVVTSSLGEVGSAARAAAAIALERRTMTVLGQREVVTVDTVRIRGSDIGRLERRKLSWVKTGFVGLVLGAMGYMLGDRLVS